MARSISDASCTFMGVNSTPSDGATDWMAAYWPIPAEIAALRRTAARVTRGATSFSSSSHFPLRAVLEGRETGDVPTRPSEAINNASTDWIGDHGKDNRHSASDLLERPDRGDASSQDYVWPEPNQLCRVFANFFGATCARAVLDLNITSINPAQLAQPVQKGGDAGLILGAGNRERHEHPNAPHALWLLPPRRNRPRSCCAPEERDEFATGHSMTSSASASIVGNTVRPRVRAVFKLRASSNRDGCITGRSAGLAPLRMRPAYRPTWCQASVKLLPSSSARWPPRTRANRRLPAACNGLPGQRCDDAWR
jgi:hypothetical protein